MVGTSFISEMTYRERESNGSKRKEIETLNNGGRGKEADLRTPA